VPRPAASGTSTAPPGGAQSTIFCSSELSIKGISAGTTKGVGALQETLKWGQPSYLTTGTKSGSTIRIDRVKSAANQYAVYFHCQTDLVETFRELYPSQLRYGGNRSILLNAAEDIPEPELRHCVALALTYHLRKRKTANGSS